MKIQCLINISNRKYTRSLACQQGTELYMTIFFFIIKLQVEYLAFGLRCTLEVESAAPLLLARKYDIEVSSVSDRNIVNFFFLGSPFPC